MDNYVTHKTPMIRRWLAKRPRWHVHLTPTSSSWLNQVERFFALLTDKKIRRGVYRSVAALRTSPCSSNDTTPIPNRSDGPNPPMTSLLPSSAAAVTMPRQNTTPCCELLVQDTSSTSPVDAAAGTPGTSGAVAAVGEIDQGQRLRGVADLKGRVTTFEQIPKWRIISEMAYYYPDALEIRD